jgi:HK97 family phage major capsid protein
MTSSDLTTTFETYKNTVETFIKSNNARLKDLETKGHTDPLITEKVEKLNQAVDGLETQLTRLKSTMTQTDDLGTLSTLSMAQKDHLSAFRSYVQKGMESDLVIHQKALSVGSDPDGGYIAPEVLSSRIIERLKSHNPLRQLATTITTQSDRVDMLVDKDKLASGWVAETDARAVTDTPKFGKLQLTTHEQYAEPHITQKLLDDAVIDVDQWLVQKIADQMANVEHTAFLTGDGANKPKGLLAYDAGTDWGKVEQLKTGEAGKLEDADVLLDAIYSFQSGYRENLSWLMSRQTLGLLRKLKDENNQYLWQPSLIQGQPATLLGMPVHTSDHMPDAADNSLSIAVADFKKAYTIVDRHGLRVLRDPFTAKPYVKFYATKRVGGGVTDFNALKLIKFSA